MNASRNFHIPDLSPIFSPLKMFCHNIRQLIFAMFELGIVPDFTATPTKQ